MRYQHRVGKNLGMKFMKIILLTVSMRGCDCVGVGISADIVLGGGGGLEIDG